MKKSLKSVVLMLAFASLFSTTALAPLPVQESYTITVHDGTRTFGLHAFVESATGFDGTWYFLSNTYVCPPSDEPNLRFTGWERNDLRSDSYIVQASYSFFQSGIWTQPASGRRYHLYPNERDPS